MMRNNYQYEFAVGTIASAGTLGIPIPPSIMLVIMADRLAMSVGDLFLGAVFPGLLLGVLYIIYIILIAMFRPALAPAPPDYAWHGLEGPARNHRAGAADSGGPWHDFFGIATPTEASGVGAFGASLLALWNKQLNLKVWREVVRQTTTTTAFIFGIVLGASAFALVLRGLGGDELIEEALLGLDLGRHGTIIAIMVIVFLLGFVIDWIQIVLIVLALVAPVVKALGFDLVWFTILFAVCLQTSFLTPPVGLALFYLKGVAPPEISTAHIYRGVVPFIIIQLLGLTLVYVFPEIATWLPRQAYGQRRGRGTQNKSRPAAKKGRHDFWFQAGRRPVFPEQDDERPAKTR